MLTFVAGVLLMRVFWVVAIILSFIAFGSGAQANTTITVTYTGTDTGTWEGNYNPLTGPGFVGGAGSLGSSTFTATFVFSIVGNYEPFSTTGVSGYTGEVYANILQNPVVQGSFSEQAQFSSLLSFTTNGTTSASDAASSGSTSQSSTDVPLYHRSSGSLSISVSSPDIPASILTGFQITDGLTGSGTAVLDYGNLLYGGGTATFDLTPETISISVIADAVPEPSTWAMMILGFVGVGAMAYRRKQSGPTLSVA
jgi:hypothetical protein